MGNSKSFPISTDDLNDFDYSSHLATNPSMLANEDKNDLFSRSCDASNNNKSSSLSSASFRHLSTHRSSDLKRGQSFRPECLKSSSPSSNKNAPLNITQKSSIDHKLRTDNLGNFQRTNSLPLSARFLRRLKTKDSIEFIQSTALNDTKQLHKGFDMLRHHFGQQDCEWTGNRLTELETSILFLNEKVSDLENCRQDCLRKLSELKSTLELEEERRRMLFLVQQQQNSQQYKNKDKIKDEKQNNFLRDAHLIRIKFLENYMNRLENLLRVDQEPFLVIAPTTTTTTTTSSLTTTPANTSSILPVSLSPKIFRKNPHYHPNNKIRKPIPNMLVATSSDNSTNTNNSNSSQSTITTTTDTLQTPAQKCHQIKQYYDYLLKTVMPQLYGRTTTGNLLTNGGNNNTNEINQYHQFRHTLLSLRMKVQNINTQQEQRLLDAKRAFIQEVDSYLNTIDQWMNDSANNGTRVEPVEDLV